MLIISYNNRYGEISLFFRFFYEKKARYGFFSYICNDERKLARLGFAIIYFRSTDKSCLKGPVEAEAKRAMPGVLVVLKRKMKTQCSALASFVFWVYLTDL